MRGVKNIDAGLRWPEKPVRLLVAGHPGGALERLAKVLGATLAADLGQPLVAECHPADGGMAAAGAVARAPADGHVLLVAASGLLTDLPHALNAGFEPRRQLQPIADLVRNNLVLVGDRRLPAADLQALIAARTPLVCASGGPASLSGLAAAMLKRFALPELRHAVRDDACEALQDVVAGAAQLSFACVASAAPLVREGKLKAFGVAAEGRSAFLPAVPAFTEVGFPDLAHAGWVGLFGPRRLPPALAMRIRGEVLVAFASAGSRERLHRLYFEPAPLAAPEQLDFALDAAYARSGVLVRACGIAPA